MSKQPPPLHTPDEAKLRRQPISNDSASRAELSEDPSKMIQIRNVLIIGKVGVGKKTIANKLCGREACKIETNTVETAARQARTENVVGEHGNYRYKLTIVDTGGLFLNNQESLLKIKNILQQLDTEGIGLLIFVIRKGGYFTMQDREQFESVIRILQPSVANISALIITGCENLKEEKRREYIQTFKSDPATRELAQFMQKGIITVGFPDLTDQDEEFRDVYERKMKRDEENLRELVESCGRVLLSKQMVLPSKLFAVAGEVKEEVTAAFRDVCSHQ